MDVVLPYLYLFVAYELRILYYISKFIIYPLQKQYDENLVLKEQITAFEEKLQDVTSDRSRRQLESQEVLAQLADHLTKVTEVTQKLQTTI